MYSQTLKRYKMCKKTAEKVYDLRKSYMMYYQSLKKLVMYMCSQSLKKIHDVYCIAKLLKGS